MTFILDEGYFSISSCVYLEDDEKLNELYFELGDQGDSQYGGLERAVLHDDKIVLVFHGEDLFLERFQTIEVKVARPAPIWRIYPRNMRHLALSRHDRPLFGACTRHLALGRHDRPRFGASTPATCAI
ncbi:MAG: hypothetical protein JRH20_05600 [Deltaproteobacteria bacterium]|nr:hypothetical protein [Deltaproteobacteria bacterium]